MQDSQEVVVAAQGHLWAADLRDNPSFPSNSSGPTSSLDAKFMEVGYITEDGPTFTVTPTTDDLMAWQSQSPIRRLKTANVTSVAASLMQWNQATFSLAFGGGAWSQPAAGIFRYTPPADNDPLPDYAIVLDLEDGDRHGRFVLFRSNITDAVETTLTRTGAALLPVTLNTLTPDDRDYSWDAVFDDEAAFGYAS